MKAKQREAQQGIAKPSIAEHIKPHYSTADDSIGKHCIGKQIKANMEQHQQRIANRSRAKHSKANPRMARHSKAKHC
jgi:hypothetical protein